MPSTPIRGLPELQGSDAAASIDDNQRSVVTILDSAAFYSTDTLANRPTAATAKQGTLFRPTDQPDYAYLSDGTSWLELSPGAGACPIGASLEWWAAGDPTDTRFVKMDGRSLSQTTYAALYALLGNAWDTFDGQVAPGAGLFRIPRVAGRVTVGAGTGSGLTNRVLGSSGGEETHALTAAENGPHGHGVSDPGHGHGVFDPGHQHTIGGGGSMPSLDANDHHFGYINAPPTYGVAGQVAIPFTGNWWGWASATSPIATGIGVNGAATGVSVQSAGSGTAHNNVQPFVVCNRIMRVA